MIAGPYKPSEDMQILRAAAESLEDYLLSQVLYWPLSGGSRERGEHPHLTPGNLLLAQARLVSANLSPAIAGEVELLSASLAGTRQRWASAWQRKCEREFSERLHLWNRTLAEILVDPKHTARLYAQDVLWRVLLELLLPETGDPLKGQLLAAPDHRLRALTIQDRFIWAAELEPSFPAERFWFLHLSFRDR